MSSGECVSTNSLFHFKNNSEIIQMLLEAYKIKARALL